jgi:DNA-binding NarL/FixJ family response regulator
MKNVLIIDDSPQIRERIAAVLAESPLIRIVGQADSYREACEAVSHLRPDTVLLDIRLPDRSGIEVLKTFKTLYPEMTVIMLTNLDDPRYRQQCRQLGADHFLSKTKDFEKIVETVINNSAH